MRRIAWTRIAATMVLAATLGLTAGCAGTGSAGVGGAPGSLAPTNPVLVDGDGSAVGPVGQNCDLAGYDAMTVPPVTRLDPLTVLASATRCLYDTQRVTGDGEWLVRIEQTTTAGLDTLAAALRVPSQQPVSGQGCPAILYAPVIIQVADLAGHRFYPAVPQTACGQPLPAATDAIAALPWVTLTTTPVRQVQTELMVDSGCQAAWKPMIALTAGGNGTRTDPPDAAPRALQVCRYDPDPDPADTISLDNGPAYRIGLLADATTFDAAAGQELLTAVAAAPAAQPCAQADSPFAVVYPVDGTGPLIYVELGGCYRTLIDSENWVRQLDGSLVDRLFG